MREGYDRSDEDGDPSCVGGGGGAVCDGRRVCVSRFELRSFLPSFPVLRAMRGLGSKSSAVGRDNTDHTTTRKRQATTTRKNSKRRREGTKRGAARGRWCMCARCGKSGRVFFEFAQKATKVGDKRSDSNYGFQKFILVAETKCVTASATPYLKAWLLLLLVSSMLRVPCVCVFTLVISILIVISMIVSVIDHDCVRVNDHVLHIAPLTVRHHRSIVLVDCHHCSFLVRYNHVANVHVDHTNNIHRSSLALDNL